MDKQASIKLTIAAVFFGLAGFFLWRFFTADSGVSEKAFFYDLSERELFVASRGLIPPIKGVNDTTEDGVRAVVISTTGKPEDKSSWKIAYLERYSPELKRQMESAQASGTSPAMGRGAAQSHRFVKRPDDREWVALQTPLGEQIVTEWTILGISGATPVICMP